MVIEAATILVAKEALSAGNLVKGWLESYQRNLPTYPLTDSPEISFGQEHKKAREGIKEALTALGGLVDRLIDKPDSLKTRRRSVTSCSRAWAIGQGRDTHSITSSHLELSNTSDKLPEESYRDQINIRAFEPVEIGEREEGLGFAQAIEAAIQAVNIDLLEAQRDVSPEKAATERHRLETELDRLFRVTIAEVEISDNKVRWNKINKKPEVLKTAGIKIVLFPRRVVVYAVEYSTGEAALLGVIDEYERGNNRIGDQVWGAVCEMIEVAEEISQKSEKKPARRF